MQPTLQQLELRHRRDVDPMIGNAGGRLGREIGDRPSRGIAHNSRDGVVWLMGRLLHGKTK